MPPVSSLPVPKGLILAPFRGLRYAAHHPAQLARLTSPPYDVIDEDERRELENTDPHNVVRLILPRDEESSPGSGYRRAAETLRRWRADGVLRPDPTQAV